MSRSFGDEKSKDLGVIAEPEFIRHNVGEDDHFIILASDGLWDGLTNDEVALICNKFKDDEVYECANSLVTAAINNYSTDNITVMVVSVQLRSHAANSVELKSLFFP
jgi:serine/threonine protein phosphatase PrpC